jgi:hypothetical protein
MKNTILASFLIAPLFLLMGWSPQDSKPATAKPQEAAAQMDDEEVAAEQLPSYPLKTCVLSGEDLGDEPASVVVNGRLVRLCCEMCAKKVSKNESVASAAIAKIDAAVIAEQMDTYPLKTCLVSGEPLEDGAIDVVHGTRLVRLCCKGCKKGFAKNPSVVMAKIDDALIAQQLPAYPVKVCLVSGEELGSGDMETFDMLYGTRLVRLCCKSCERAFKKKPDTLLAKLDAAMASRKAAPVEKK